MKGDFSRTTFDRKNHYNGVRWQQGRPMDDAGLNEAQDINSYRIETEALDVIGQSGAPQDNPGFELFVGDDGDLMIGAGRFYVDGILCENEAQISYADQDALHLPDPPLIADLMDDATIGLVYLDVFKRHLTFHDRDEIREIALNGVDTTTRLQTIWQVKVLPLPSVTLTAAQLSALTELADQIASLNIQIADETDPEARADLMHQRDQRQRELLLLAESMNIDCASSFSEWDELLTPPTGTLEVDTIDPETITDPCDVPPGGGYTRMENQYYIVQVHSVPTNGSRNGATFKWSRDNGHIVARIEAVGNATAGTATGNIFDVNRVQRDDYLGIHNDDWVEYVDDGIELNGAPGVFAQVTNADADLNRITLDRDVTVDLDRNPKLRKWDQSGGAATEDGIAMNTTNTPVELEGGLQVEFATGTYRPGDFWQFAARTVTGKIDFPTGPQPRFGVDHHYARLGVVAFVDDELSFLLDCRALFPPLTDISAADVSFDNSFCNLPDARTVQDAIDHLCSRTGGTCTLNISPGPNWHQVFDQIPKGEDAEICFALGDYLLREPVLIAEKGNIILTGVGRGTRILVPTAESALRFENCQSVTVRSMHVETGSVDEGQGLLGALTFVGCVAVHLDNAWLRCPSWTVRAASCLRVINPSPFADVRTTNGRVDIQNCYFEVGNNQIGALIINGSRILFENNIVRPVDTRDGTMRIPDGLQENADLRAEVRRVIFDNLEEGRSTNRDRVNLNISDQVVNFYTAPELQEIKLFSQLVELVPPKGVEDFVGAREYLQDAVDQALLDLDLIQGFADFFGQMVKEDLPVFYQGLTIGGEEAEEVRVINNTFIDALQGIHVGQSRRNQPPEERLKSTIVSFQGNTIYSRVTPTVNSGAFGIYIGNCESLLIENNALFRQDLKSTAHIVMNGIYGVGEFGKRLIIRHNEAAAYTNGVYLEPESDFDQVLWLVADNVASVQPKDPRIQDLNNVP